MKLTFCIVWILVLSSCVQSRSPAEPELAQARSDRVSAQRSPAAAGLISAQIAGSSDPYSKIFNIRDFGATGYGASSTPTLDTPGIQKAIDTVISKGGRGIVYIPAGYYGINATLTVANAKGIIIQGEGPESTTLAPTAMGGKPVLYLVNCVSCEIRGLKIAGNTGGLPSSAIESRVDSPPNSGAFPTNLLVDNVSIGNPDLGNNRIGLQNGIRFTANPASDGNNDQSVINHVSFGGIADAAISIEHSNSLIHRFSNLRIFYSRIAVQTRGGSYLLNSSVLGATEVDFEFLDPAPTTIYGRPSSGYYHPIMISNTMSESTSDLLRTTAWPYGAPKSNGQTGINIYMTNIDKRGTRVPPNYPKNTAAELYNTIDYKSSGKVSITNSELFFGRDTNLSFSDPRSMVSIIGSYVTTVHQVNWAGQFYSAGNYYVSGAMTRNPGPNATLTTSGDSVDFPNSTWPTGK